MGSSVEEKALVLTLISGLNNTYGYLNQFYQLS